MVPKVFKVCKTGRKTLQTNSFTERIYNIVKTFLKELFHENPSKINRSTFLMLLLQAISKFESMKPFISEPLVCTDFHPHLHAHHTHFRRVRCTRTPLFAPAPANFSKKKINCIKIEKNVLKKEEWTCGRACALTYLKNDLGTHLHVSSGKFSAPICTKIAAPARVRVRAHARKLKVSLLAFKYFCRCGSRAGAVWCIFLNCSGTTRLNYQFLVFTIYQIKKYSFIQGLGPLCCSTTIDMIGLNKVTTRVQPLCSQQCNGLESILKEHSYFLPMNIVFINTLATQLNKSCGSELLF